MLLMLLSAYLDIELEESLKEQLLKDLHSISCYPKIIQAKEATNDFELTAGIVYLKEKALGWRNKQIRQNDDEAKYINILAKQAQKFTDKFSLSHKAGYNMYFELGYTALGRKYSLIKLTQQFITICEMYNELSIVNSSNLELLGNAISYYSEQLKRRKRIDYVASVENYKHFAYMLEDMQSLNCLSIEKWIDAQINTFLSMQIFPMPNQLYGPNAKTRYIQSLPVQSDEKLKFSEFLNNI